MKLSNRLLNLFAVLMLLVGFAMAQQPVNVLNVGGTAASTGNGTSGAGDLRVNIASDNTAFQVKVTGNGGASFDVAQGGGTAATNALQEACVFNTSLPTLTNGQGGAINCDAKAQQFMDLNYVAGSAINVGHGTAAGSIRVELPTDGTGVVGLIAGAATIGKVDLLGNSGAAMDFAGQNASSPANSLLIGAQFNTSPTTITSGSASPLQMDNTGHLLVNCTGCSGSSTVGLVPQTSGGLTLAHTVAAASTNATSTKASAGQVYHVCVNSNAAYPVYLKLFNKASAPTVGTDTPVKVMEAQAGVPACLSSEDGLAFGTGIAWALTKGITDADATAVLISDATVELAYK